MKASFATTNECCKGGQFVLGARALPGNPYDGHTLAEQIDQVARLTDRKVRRAYVDRGYRGHGVERDGLDITLSHTRGITSPTIRREMRRRRLVTANDCRGWRWRAFVDSSGYPSRLSVRTRQEHCGCNQQAINAPCRRPW